MPSRRLALLLALTATTPYPKLDSHLRRLVAPAPTPSSQFAPSTHLWERDGKVHVRITTDDPSDPALRNAGLDARHTSRDRVEGWLPAQNLEALQNVPTVRGVRPVLPGRLRATADGASRADLARATGFDGSGITVGVISDGKGSLPDSVVPAGCTAGSGSEGQAISEIVGTLAPGTRRLFSEGISSSQAFIDSVACLRAAGATVIVDDIGFFDEPFFQDGSVADAVAQAVAAGVSFHSAAGNEAGEHYAATFRGDVLHDFSGAGDTFDDITVRPGDTLDCVLQWDDPFGGSSNDYDLELYDMGQATPVLVTDSTDPQTGTQDPIEVVSAVNRGGSTGRAGIAIRRAAGDVRDLKLFCFGGDTYQYVTPAGSLIGHPAVPGVVAVGAIDVADPGLDTVEAYSSQGPVTIRFPVPETRAKPDLAAFDGVTTATPDFSPFFGTSAAAPDSAAVAALLLEKNGCLVPADVRQHLVGTAVDIGVPGVDPVSGAGRLDARAAIDATPLPACDDGDACTTDTCEPGRGCVHTALEGAEALTCICDAGLTPAECNDLPRSLAARLRRVCRVANRATGASARRVRAVARRLVVLLDHTARAVTAAESHGAIDDACSTALGARLDDTRARAAALRASL
jgi:Subtilase family/Dictyostelium (slime mold) repeat